MAVIAELGRALFLVAAGRGIALEPLLPRASIPREALVDLDSDRSRRLFVEVLHSLEAMTGDNMPMALVGSMPTRLMGPARTVIERAPDLATMFHLLGENADLFDRDLRIEFVRHARGDFVGVSHPLDEIDGGVGAEFAIGWGLRAVSSRFRLPAYEVHFRHTPRGDPAAYRALLGPTVRFGRVRNRLVFPGGLSGKRATPRDEERLRRHLALLREDHGLEADDGLGDVHRAIRACADRRDFSAEALAAALHTSPRSLQRRLGARGLTARRLLDDERRGRAVELLDTNLGVGEIADQLGFATERGFRKAFRRWTGITPASFRRERPAVAAQRGEPQASG